jgi:hypothetical protein
VYYHGQSLKRKGFDSRLNSDRCTTREARWYHQDLAARALVCLRACPFGDLDHAAQAAGPVARPAFRRARDGQQDDRDAVLSCGRAATCCRAAFLAVKIFS